MKSSIKRIRADFGLSQSQLARRMHVSRSHISNLETGHRKTTKRHLRRAQKAVGQS